jgi:phosphatidylglycerol:prolipoprotein diacylglycerol transferase
MDQILWNVSPEIIQIGPLTLRWYGLFWALSFLVGYYLITSFYKREGKNTVQVDTLAVYMIVGTILGARIGHFLFYEPKLLLTKPWELLFVWEGGMASHGAALGILIAIFIYSRKFKEEHFFYVLDRLVIAVAIAGCFIRLGNLMNSEIIGKPTNADYGFLFVHGIEEVLLEERGDLIKKVSVRKNDERINDAQYPLRGIDVELTIQGRFKEGNVKDFIEQEVAHYLNESRQVWEDQKIVIPPGFAYVTSKNAKGQDVVTLKLYAVPRQPSQIYEAFSSLLIFLSFFLIYRIRKGNIPEGFLFGLFCVILFSLRFYYEFGKENQVDFEDNLSLNMGQILSLPLIAAGLFAMVRSIVLNRNTKLNS